MWDASSPEIVVMGGGPAGCAAATLLARWGHRVQVRAKPATAAVLAESLPPSTSKLLEVIGVRDQIDRAGFVRSTGNTVWWGSRSPRVEHFTGGQRGWQVTRQRLEAILLPHAIAAGATVHQGRIAPVDPRSAAFVLDCTGRTGLFARARTLRVYDDSRQRTIALLATWHGPASWPLADPTHTVIESYEGGWAWSVPTAADERCIAVMVDPVRSNLQRAATPLEVYREQLHHAPHLRDLVAGAELTAGPFGWDASAYHATRYVDDNVLLVGDAGSFIDPLSSAGVKKALVSGWLAAVAVHTALSRPAMRQTALAFFDRREREVYASVRALTRRFFSDAAAGHAHPFWVDRDSDPPPDDAMVVKQSFERLRSEETLRVRRNPTVRTEARPAVSGIEIVLQARLVTGDDDDGVGFLWDVDALALLDLAPAYSSVPDLFAAYNRRHEPVALPDFLMALSTLLARRLLLWL